MVHIIYSNTNGEKVDLGTIEGIKTIINDIYSQAKNANGCLIIKENIKAAAEECYKNYIAK
jgi:hypothetical protein